ncbi:MAG: DegT/DnrJ/EryC1/StrS family aminotransferase [Gemmatimonadota bacterium]|nr:DegT/DnrJ/EryC1/StrS family aminotransferase [Gemmatimonadota bacterium]
MSKLAIHGGRPVCKPPIDPSAYRPLRFTEPEREALGRVMDTGALCRIFGSETESLEAGFATYFGPGFHAVASSSGTAAIHTALAAAGVGWQDEVITSPVTDMGSIIGIVAQGALPVFADIDELTYNMTADNVAKAVTSRTRAILVIHLAGLACDMDPILEIARRHDIAVVEDCAQSWLAESQGRPVGTLGTIGCFSLNGFKHISCGDGGICLTRNEGLAHRMRLFTDKAYDRRTSLRNPSVFAMNYRMTELQAAVGRVQLDKLAGIISRREEIVSRLLAGLAGTPGLVLPRVPGDDRHSWWYLTVRRDPELIEAGALELTDALAAEGLPAWTGYCGGMPVYLYDCFTRQDESFFRLPPLVGSEPGFPESLYPQGLCPVAERMLEEMIIIPINEFYTPDEVDNIARGLEKVFSYYVS